VGLLGLGRLQQQLFLFSGTPASSKPGVFQGLLDTSPKLRLQVPVPRGRKGSAPNVGDVCPVEWRLNFSLSDTLWTPCSRARPSGGPRTGRCHLTQGKFRELTLPQKRQELRQQPSGRDGIQGKPYPGLRVTGTLSENDLVIVHVTSSEHTCSTPPAHEQDSADSPAFLKAREVKYWLQLPFASLCNFKARILFALAFSTLNPILDLAVSSCFFNLRGRIFKSRVCPNLFWL
jgi:hypothetical protein